MLTNQNIIYFSNDWNADNRTSSHHIARQLARGNRLLYVESSGLRSPGASGHDLKRMLRKIFLFLKGARRMTDQVYVFTPLILPFHRMKWARWLNARFMSMFLRRIIKRLKFNDPVLWIIIPHMGMLLGRLNEKLVVYYCVDDFSSLPGVDSDIVRQFDQDLTKKADIVFTPSRPLYDKKKKFNNKTFLSPHGVDIAHFSHAQQMDAIPEDIAGIPGPRAMFIGLIESWVDLDLIAYAAQKLHAWSFIMIGRCVQDIRHLEGIPNIYFLGPRPYTQLPRYLAAVDVALIPYVLNDQVHNANPIKLREYLASGKPVVSVRNPEIEKFTDCITIADNYDKFVAKIEEVYQQDTPEQVSRRIHRVEDSSWEARFEKISEIIETRIHADKKDADTRG